MTDPSAYTDRLLHAVDAETVFWDIGAYHGRYSKLASDRGATVYAFEPQPHLQMDAGAADVFRIALGESQRIVRLDTSTEHDSTHRRMPDGAPDGVAALLMRMDDVAEAGLEPPTVVKIDVEGQELSVLRGGYATIARHRPLIGIEVHTDAVNGGLEAYGHDADEVRAWFDAAGYEVEVVEARERDEHWLARPR